MRVVAVIPARFASTRFPGKPLASVLGKPMVQWVYERAQRVRGFGRILVATDDTRIFEAVRGFGGEALMTPAECPSGSDRVFHAARDISCDVVVNLQGDEPTLEPDSVRALLQLMGSEPELQMGTLVAPLESPADYENPNVVKVALGADGRCLYFSRSPIPYLRQRAPGPPPLWRHVGIYAYRKDFLEAFTRWPRGVLEAAEELEQLRVLERGHVVKAAAVDWPGCAVDTPGDVPAAEAYLRRQVP